MYIYICRLLLITCVLKNLYLLEKRMYELNVECNVGAKQKKARYECAQL